MQAVSLNHPDFRGVGKRRTNVMKRSELSLLSSQKDEEWVQKSNNAKGTTKVRTHELLNNKDQILNIIL